MLDAFSYNREYDYIRLEGLSRVTGRPAHEWDFYIVKELIDNALDADEVLWSRDNAWYPSLSIGMEYITVPPPQSQQLIVRVGNRVSFPVERITHIFATQWYTSHKSFLKGTTRGALGNALKTLLGIPYALHNRVAEDWKPDLKPLSICCGAIEYLPNYLVDPTAQTIRFTCEQRPCSPVTGSLISVGLDYFVQERPRLLAEIEILAQQCFLCNPHVEFHWKVELPDQLWEKKYPPQTMWRQKYHELAPVQWYSLAGFREFLGALYRYHQGKTGNNAIPVELVCRSFAGFSAPAIDTQQGSRSIAQVVKDVRQEWLTPEDINSPFARTLYTTISKYSPLFHASQLGCIGQEHIQSQLQSGLPIKGKIQYIIATDTDNDPAMPFVIEVAAAYLQEGKRQVWTAINFSPTYNDPFLSRWFHPPSQSDELVLGLRGILDTYDVRENTNMVLFLHLICPNTEHTEFSKTEINHLPFKKVLCESIDRVLKELRQGQEEEAMRLEQVIFQALDVILRSRAENERFIPEQLLETLRKQLSQDAALIDWLERPEALNRLRAYIESYQDDNPEFNTFIARQAETLLYIPSHPKHYFSIPIGQLSSDLLEKHAVNKILCVQSAALEPVVIANNWLCCMDMALLQTSTDVHVLQESLLHCVAQSELPILVLHEADGRGYALVEQMRLWLKEHRINARRIIDLHESQGQGVVLQPTKVMPDELETWLLKRFMALNVPVKYTPLYAQLVLDIRSSFEHLLREHVIEDMEQQFALTPLIQELDTMFAYTSMMRDVQVDARILYLLQHTMKSEPYHTVLNKTVESFFEYFIRTYGSRIYQLELTWFVQKREGNS